MAGQLLRDIPQSYGTVPNIEEQMSISIGWQNRRHLVIAPDMIYDSLIRHPFSIGFGTIGCLGIGLLYYFRSAMTDRIRASLDLPAFRSSSLSLTQIRRVPESPL
jgi:hypothetical protein